MNWVEKIRNKPQKEKIRIIWIAMGLAGAALVLLWIFTSRIGDKTAKDTTLFQTLGRGIKDIRDNYNK
jgi:predicted permease